MQLVLGDLCSPDFTLANQDLWWQLTPWAVSSLSWLFNHSTKASYLEHGAFILAEIVFLFKRFDLFRQFFS